MRPEDQTNLDTFEQTLDAAFGMPTDAEKAISRVVLAAATLKPLIRLTHISPAHVDAPEWLTPGLVDAIERAALAVDELYNEFESEADDVTILEPGTMGAQEFTDLPVSAARVAAGGRPPGTRGELIR